MHIFGYGCPFLILKYCRRKGCCNTDIWTIFSIISSENECSYETWTKLFVYIFGNCQQILFWIWKYSDPKGSFHNDLCDIFIVVWSKRVSCYPNNLMKFHIKYFGYGKQILLDFQYMPPQEGAVIAFWVFFINFLWFC